MHPDVKAARLAEALAVYRAGQASQLSAEVGSLHIVLVEGPSRKDPTAWAGKTCTNKRVVFPGGRVPGSGYGAGTAEPRPGEYVAVLVEGVTGGTLLGRALRLTSIESFVSAFGSTTPGVVSDLLQAHMGAVESSRVLGAPSAGTAWFEDMQKQAVVGE